MFLFLIFISLYERFNCTTDLYQVAGVDYSITTEQIRDTLKDYYNNNNTQPNSIEALEILNSTYLRRIYDLYGIEGLKDSNNYNGKTNIIKTFRIVPLYDFYRGCKYSFILTRSRVCKCPHPGYFCDLCRGNQLIQEDVSLNLELKRGAADPFVFTIHNITDSSENLSPSNLKVVIQSNKNGYASRDVNDIHIESPEKYNDLYVGYNLSYYFIDEQVHWVELTEVSPVIVVKGMGMPIEGTERFGDLFIHIEN